MSRVQNLHIHRDSPEELKTLSDEYIYLGYRVKLSSGKLTVFALSKRKKSESKKHEDKNSRRSRSRD